MPYRVEFSGRAKNDLRMIRDWLASHSRDGAMKWLDALDELCQQLTTSALETNPAPEAAELGIDLRQQMFKTRKGRHYRLLLLIDNQRVIIAAIRGPGQDAVQQDELGFSD